MKVKFSSCYTWKEGASDVGKIIMLQHDDVSSDGQDEVKKWKKQLLLEKREISRVENSYKVLIISMT